MLKYNVMKALKKMSLYLNEEELDSCTIMPENPVLTILDSKKAFNLALKNYSKKLKAKYPKKNLFI